MSDDEEDQAEQKVGYGKPPKTGQFKKGQSGNPRGRPRKKKVEKREWIETQFPTREILRAEAKRKITVKDASGSKEIPATEGVVRATAQTAMRGSPYAQRTFLQYQVAEDERQHQEAKKRCEFWSDEKERRRAAIEKARKAGKPDPVFVPHPDDIVVDWHKLEVRFLGAVDEEGLIAEKLALKLQRLGFEMSIYLDEDNALPVRQGEDGRIGFYMALYLWGALYLPPRLRMSGEELEAAVQQNAYRGIEAWGDDLESRCQDEDFPFMRWYPGIKMPTRSTAKLGVKWTPAMGLAMLQAEADIAAQKAERLRRRREERKSKK